MERIRLYDQRKVRCWEECRMITVMKYQESLIFITPYSGHYFYSNSREIIECRRFYGKRKRSC